MGPYTLPELEFDYSALEPHISGKIMELHHGKHHAAYVQGANGALDHLAAARERGDFSSIAGLEKALAFNVSGHLLHSLFWKSLSPEGGDRPTGALAEAINADFGGFDGFQKHLTAATAGITGSGWGALVYDPAAGRLLVSAIHDHQSDTIFSGVPLLVLDAWEHAYYLQYQNRKAEYFDAIWNLWSWSEIADRFNTARRVDLQDERLRPAEHWLSRAKDVSPASR